MMLCAQLQIMLRAHRLRLFASCIATFLLLCGYYFIPFDTEIFFWPTAQDVEPLEPIPDSAHDTHPIIQLVHNAQAAFDHLLSKETHDVASASAAYRERRGRHPPPGFDKWHAYASERNAIVVEEFWDQIYHDLAPLWALDQKQMREHVEAQEEIIRIRNHKVSSKSGFPWTWTKIWKELVRSVAKDLPDLDIAINTMDEPRLFVRWEDMERYMGVEQSVRAVAPLQDVTSQYMGSPDIDAETDVDWSSEPLVFDRASLACPPDSLARNSLLQIDFSGPPVLSTEFMTPHSYNGYVSNYTLSTSVCHQPDLQGLHGIFIEATSIKTSNTLFPLFGGSKLAVNSEILLPPAMYYSKDSRFTSNGRSRAWSQKAGKLFWRGLASGGRNKKENWKGFHRHRLVSMLNGTQAISMPDSEFIAIRNLPLEMWQLEAWNDPGVPRNQAMGEWLSTFCDAAFTGLECFPREELGCAYADRWFEARKSIKLADHYKYKYLVDVDGNSFSGRYRDFLLSTSLPIKATLFQEWHDSRLVAWKHFVPLDNRFLDIYGVMEFFLGYDVGGRKSGGRDQLARRIATQGQDWAKKVLRREDMSIYTYRLLLEYARVMDKDRDSLGWIGDLVEHVVV